MLIFFLPYFALLLSYLFQISHFPLLYIFLVVHFWNRKWTHQFWNKKIWQLSFIWVNIWVITHNCPESELEYLLWSLVTDYTQISIHPLPYFSLFFLLFAFFLSIFLKLTVKKAGPLPQGVYNILYVTSNRIHRWQ